MLANFTEMHRPLAGQSESVGRDTRSRRQRESRWVMRIQRGLPAAELFLGQMRTASETMNVSLHVPAVQRDDELAN